jgi:hypothetical protein
LDGKNEARGEVFKGKRFRQKQLDINPKTLTQEQHKSKASNVREFSDINLLVSKNWRLSTTHTTQHVHSKRGSTNVLQYTDLAN